MRNLIGLGPAFLALAISASALGQGHHGPERGHHGEGDHQEGPTRDRHAAGARPRVGTEVEDFAVTDNTGKAFRLGTLRRTEASLGKIAVLTFWCTTCGSCRQIEKAFDKKAKEYKGDRVQFFMVDSNFTDSVQRVNRFLEKNDLSFPVLMDSESRIARYFGTKLTTTTAVIDAEGRIRYYGGFGKAEDAVRNLLAGKDVLVPESPTSG
jgi:peroxiredoxin